MMERDLQSLKRAGRAAAALLLAGTVTAAPAAGQDRCAASGNELQSLVEDVHQRHRSVGIQAAIVIDDRLVFSTALGLASIEPKRPMGPDTRIHIASVAKAFTGVAALRAADQKLLSLDAPIQTYAPTFPRNPHFVVTARRLAAHRAGLKHWGAERQAFFSQRFTLEQAVDNAGDRPYIDQATTGYLESSYGYNLLGLAIQQAASTRFATYVEREVIGPLHLGRTRFLRGPTPEHGDAHIYTLGEAKGSQPQAVALRDYSHSMAGGNMSSTAADLARFGAGLLRESFLSATSRALLTTRPAFDGVASETSFGFAVAKENDAPTLQAVGIVPGVQASVRIYPERKVAVAVVSNTTGADRDMEEFIDAFPRKLAALCLPT